VVVVVVAFLFTGCLYYIQEYVNIRQPILLQQPSLTPFKVQDMEKFETNLTIWAAMGLCYDAKRTELNGKGNFPYLEATPLALLLWKYHQPQVKTIVRIVHNSEQVSEEMVEYGRMLERAGAVVEFIQTQGMDCPVMSLITRLVAGEHPMIREEDIVMPVDVDLFVLNPNILQHFTDAPAKQIWIPRYEDTAHKTEGGVDQCFGLSLISMRASLWRRVLNYTGKISDLVKNFIKETQTEEGLETIWYIDQTLTTYYILKSRLCTVPKTSGQWGWKGLEYKEVDDSSTCFHGSGYADCNKARTFVGQGCKWWHFHPDERMVEDLMPKFAESCNNRIQLYYSRVGTSFTLTWDEGDLDKAMTI